ncbi:SIMPL domain-containing protein [Aliarcobacter vitoriensis]|uniref:SIMPL domain-containing protein n=1 Tax=Aliarcobacter vitoriensis TaxID=2011099 RepID=A0A366MR86_9BACT|nr:SIMPL domain-containing protein [Aliarcobacter vitoriensis]RBQ28801.1 SIMPL domain-containing protein [Aliarcobacter vitoriensis]
MNKKILATALFLPILGFSYELSFTKVFEKKVNGDLLTSNISISVDKKDEKSVNNEIEKFNNFIKNTKNITIKNTNYSLYPKYEYEKDKSVFKGYSGNSSFSIESKDAKEINTFLSELMQLKDSIKSNDLKLNISHLSWSVSKILLDKNVEELRLESLLWIDEYSKELSSKISKKCEIKSVNSFEQRGISGVYARKSMMMSSDSVNYESSSDISPLNTEQNISLETSYVLDCK